MVSKNNEFSSSFRAEKEVFSDTYGGSRAAALLSQGGKSGLQQAWWLLTGADRKVWKVPQKSYRFS